MLRCVGEFVLFIVASFAIVLTLCVVPLLVVTMIGW